MPLSVLHTGHRKPHDTRNLVHQKKFDAHPLLRVEEVALAADIAAELVDDVLGGAGVHVKEGRPLSASIYHPSQNMPAPKAEGLCGSGVASK